jgi:hypothetical protein
MIIRIFKKDKNDNIFVYQEGKTKIEALGLDVLTGKVKKTVKQHLSNGGAISFFPPGTINSISLTANEKEVFWGCYNR